MKKNISTSLFQKEQVLASIKQSFVKLDPRMMIKNPIMFTVEVVTLLMLPITFYSLVDPTQGSFGYNMTFIYNLVCDFTVCQFCRSDSRSKGESSSR